MHYVNRDAIALTVEYLARTLWRLKIYRPHSQNSTESVGIAL